MGSGNYLKRVLKNPKFLLSRYFLLHPISSTSTIKKIMRNNYQIIAFVEKMTDENQANLRKFLEDIKQNNTLQNHIEHKFLHLVKMLEEEKFKNFDYHKENPTGRIGRPGQEDARFLLYVLIRALKPEKVIETGVSSGESSCYILQALMDNDKGKLYSIDLPPKKNEEHRNFPTLPNQTSGWIVPDNLRKRWELSLGSSQELLLPLLNKLGRIDVFFHDSLHTYENMMFEYSTVWPHIKENGVLISDDIATLDNRGHSPLIDFAEKEKKQPIIFHLVGGIKK